MKLSSKKGFTLIELIIVIAILGIIALIAVPNLAGIRQRSQVSADKRTAEQIGKAVRIWATDIDAGVRPIPADTANLKAYDNDTALPGLCETYISSGYTAKSLTAGPGNFYVTSTKAADDVNNATQKIIIGISKTGTDLGSLPADADDVTYDGTEAGWAYLEK